MNELQHLTIHVFYTGTDGGARKFAQEMLSCGLADEVRREPGNLGYAYYYPAEDPETVLLIDSWRDQAALDAHHKSDMMKRIAVLRARYGLRMRAERFVPADDEGRQSGRKG
ncbi:MAG: putative quinol monooxygenase [Oscillospiraceae bacterium]|nr:putative quinol monooxygenase [Oscillospiraceae bacterium]